MFLDSITIFNLSISLDKVVIVLSASCNLRLISLDSCTLLFNSLLYSENCLTLALNSSISLLRLVTVLLERRSFYWPYRTCPDNPWFYSPSLLILCWNELNSFINLLCSLADCLSLSCPSLTYLFNPSTSLIDLSYLPPVSCNLLSSSLFLPSNCSTCLLKASISVTSFWTWFADNLNFSCPYLTCPIRSLFSPVKLWILPLKSFNWLSNLPVSLADYLSLFWPYLTCLSRSWLSVFNLPCLPSVSLSLLLSSSFSLLNC